jgi:putative hemolysin
MALSSLAGLAAVALLVLANGFFVATEFAIVAVRRSRLEQLVDEGRAGAAAAQAVVQHLDSYIAATQFGITLASLALGWLGEPALAHLLEPPLAMLAGSYAPTAAHGLAIGVAFALITALHIVLGELAPKGLALQHPELTSLWVARPIQVFHTILKWPITGLNAVGNGTLRLFGLEPATGHEMVHSVEELRLLVTGMQEAGVVDATEARIARRAFAFGERTAASLMTPRTEIGAIRADASIDEALRVSETTRRQRLPVFDGSLDNIVGVVYIRDLMAHRRTQDASISLQALTRPPLLVPETRYAADLLEDMRLARSHIAIVVDEYGGTAGLVTLRDLLEALVGQIDDVRSDDTDVRDDRSYRADGSIVLDGMTRIEEFEEFADIRVSDALRGHVETVGGLVPAAIGRVPHAGEELVIQGRTLRVEALDGLRVSSVRLMPLATASSRTEPGA